MYYAGVPKKKAVELYEGEERWKECLMELPSVQWAGKACERSCSQLMHLGNFTCIFTSSAWSSSSFSW